MINNIIRLFLENKLVTVLITLFFISWGIVTAPFDWAIDLLPSDPVAVDAIPDIGENQQIVFTEWTGRSPQDIEDQITYPLTTSLLGVPGVKTIRSSSMFGFSSIYLIFEEDVDFYWSRSRILEKLNALPAGTLPEGVQPALGPDATALGQIYWYTLEGRSPEGEVTGGWDLQELRTLQDFYVKYGLSSAEGVSEVASIGGYVKEYQVDVDPAALRAYNISLDQVRKAIKKSNLDVGAQTIEINQAEYLLRGIGYIKSLKDLEQAVVTVNDNVPIRISDIAFVHYGPSTRRGVLDKSGAEVVGGVVVARYGANPMEVIQNVKVKIDEIAAGLPSKELQDGTISQVTIVPFYDRTELIHETLGTLEEALTLEIIITIIVVLIMVMNLRTSLLISSLLPLGVLMTFIAMRYLGVDANIVALSGIAIAIGTMVDTGIILTENMLRHLKQQQLPDRSGYRKPVLEIIYDASTEVAPALVTAIATTIISFIPVFTLEAAEGKLFRPLAFTKTFALFAAIIITLIILPAFAHWVLGFRIDDRRRKIIWNILVTAIGIICLFVLPWAGWLLLTLAVTGWLEATNGGARIWPKSSRFGTALASLGFLPPQRKPFFTFIKVAVAVVFISWLLARTWLPLSPSVSTLVNFIFVALIIAFVLGLFHLIIRYYSYILNFFLDHKALFLTVPAFLVVIGLSIWMGFATLFGFIPRTLDKVGWDIRTTSTWSGLAHTFPGIGQEFMPALDEGSFLLMPTSMPHTGVEKNIEYLKMLDMAVTSIPEVELVVGKMGRAATALDPAPISMFENVINYKSEYVTDENGRRVRFAVDEEGRFMVRTIIDGEEEFTPIPQEERFFADVEQLIPDKDGQYFRQWRDHIHSPDDIWENIVRATNIPGVTSAPKLQPIETRLIMLQTGMRAPMGIKVNGPDLVTIEDFGKKLELILQEVPSVKESAVFADRVVGKPYLHIDINREAIGRYGLTIADVQMHIQLAIGGMPLTMTVEGRERYPVRMRYPRELRNDPETLKEVLIPTPTRAQVPLGQLAEINYVQGPQVIKSENTFLQSYVLFDKAEGYAEMTAVTDAQKAIRSRIDEGTLVVPEGLSYQFAGNYENQVRATKRLSLIVPLVLGLIFLIIYFQFRRVSTTLMIFSGIIVAFSGGFLMLWLYGQGGFMDFSLFDTNMRNLFQMNPVNLSVAVWVGFIALFGIATDDGVVMATYLKQTFARHKPTDRKGIRIAVVRAGRRRVRPCLMTTGTTILALLPILTSTGRGADIMIPMAIPIVGGMAIALITIFIIPVLYEWWELRKLRI